MLHIKINVDLPVNIFICAVYALCKCCYVHRCVSQSQEIHIHISNFSDYYCQFIAIVIYLYSFKDDAADKVTSTITLSSQSPAEEVYTTDDNDTDIEIISVVPGEISVPSDLMSHQQDLLNIVLFLVRDQFHQI